jgi:hypothetical protein
MGLISTWLRGKAKDVKRDQHHQFEMNSIQRPMAIKIRAAANITEMQEQLDANPKLKAVYDKLKLTNPPD